MYHKLTKYNKGKTKKFMELLSCGNIKPYKNHGFARTKNCVSATLDAASFGGFGTGFPSFLDIWIFSRHLWSSFISQSAAFVEFSSN